MIRAITLVSTLIIAAQGSDLEKRLGQLVPIETVHEEKNEVIFLDSDHTLHHSQNGKLVPVNPGGIGEFEKIPEAIKQLILCFLPEACHKDVFDSMMIRKPEIDFLARMINQTKPIVLVQHLTGENESYNGKYTNSWRPDAETLKRYPQKLNYYIPDLKKVGDDKIFMNFRINADRDENERIVGASCRVTILELGEDGLQFERKLQNKQRVGRWFKPIHQRIQARGTKVLSEKGLEKSSGKIPFAVPLCMREKIRNGDTAAHDMAHCCTTIPEPEPAAEEEADAQPEHVGPAEVQEEHEDDVPACQWPTWLRPLQCIAKLCGF